MKKMIYLCLIAITAFSAQAQPPTYFNYQALVRDAGGNILSERGVGFKIEILKENETGTVVFRETHDATTDKFGRVTLKIFGGDHDGMWMPINWTEIDYFLKIYLDPDGGNSYTEMGVAQLLSVPYAMHASTVDNSNLPGSYVDFAITGTFKLGSNGIYANELYEISGVTHETNNTISFTLPAGYNEFNTFVLAVQVFVETTGISGSRLNYGLGYTATNGTIGYRFGYFNLVQIGQSHYRMTIYYPDELKDKSFSVLLLRKALIM
jgi:hypothetical protein